MTITTNIDMKWLTYLCNNIRILALRQILSVWSAYIVLSQKQYILENNYNTEIKCTTYWRSPASFIKDNGRLKMHMVLGINRIAYETRKVNMRHAWTGTIQIGKQVRAV